MLGLQLRRAVHRVVHLQFEALLVQKGNALKNDPGDLHNVIVINYVEVPVLARLDVKRWGRNAVSIHAGPAFAVIAGSRETNNSHHVERPVKLKPFDIGIAFGGQLEVWKIIAGARYTMGLSNVFADDPELFGFSRMKNTAVTVFAGYAVR
jgi:hypothetical protein